MEANQTTVLNPLATDAPCDRCGNPGGVVAITQEWTFSDPHQRPETWQIELCARCLAEAIKLGTGFQAPKQLESWYELRALAAARRAARGESLAELTIREAVNSVSRQRTAALADRLDAADPAS